MKEVWKPIKGFEEYYSVSNLGLVRSEERYVNSINGPRIVRERILKPKMDETRRLQVVLSKNCKLTTYRVHKLVSNAFLGPCPKGMEVRHKNSIESDCKLNNLVYGTKRRNQFDRNGNGTTQLGYANSKSKITIQIVIAIRRLRNKRTQDEIAELFHISPSHVSRIQLYKVWNPDDWKKALNEMWKATEELHGGVWSKRRGKEYDDLYREWQLLHNN